jgi:hypothetical protein
MERQLWKGIVQVVNTLDQSYAPRCKFSDARIVAVWYWAVVNDRPYSWACDKTNWPMDLRRFGLPSISRMCRRLRSASVQTLLRELEQRVIAPKEPGLCWLLDGKPLPIGGCSKDRQSGYGRSASGMARGYKLHVIANVQGEIAAWRLAPMNVDERTMAARMLRSTGLQGYIIADANYDSNPLHAICDQLGNRQLVAPRRYGPGYGLGRHRHSAGRLRCVELLENPFPEFGQELLNIRRTIERHFGNWTSWGGGLTSLPPWIRSYRRVHRWVQAKLVLSAIKRRMGSITCAA